MGGSRNWDWERLGWGREWKENQMWLQLPILEIGKSREIPPESTPAGFNPKIPFFEGKKQHQPHPKSSHFFYGDPIPFIPFPLHIYIYLFFFLNSWRSQGRFPLSDLAVDFEGEAGEFFLGGFAAVLLLWELDAGGFLPLQRWRRQPGEGRSQICGGRRKNGNSGIPERTARMGSTSSRLWDQGIMEKDGLEGILG